MHNMTIQRSNAALFGETWPCATRYTDRILTLLLTTGIFTTMLTLRHSNNARPDCILLHVSKLVSK